MGGKSQEKGILRFMLHKKATNDESLATRAAAEDLLTPHPWPGYGFFVFPPHRRSILKVKCVCLGNIHGLVSQNKAKSTAFYVSSSLFLL